MLAVFHPQLNNLICYQNSTISAMYLIESFGVKRINHKDSDCYLCKKYSLDRRLSWELVGVGKLSRCLNFWNNSEHQH